MSKSKKAGRPSKYNPIFANQARKLCLAGYTDKQLADHFEVSEATLYTWKKKHPDFLEALKKGKAIADGEVAASLYERACGYSHPETKVFNYLGQTFEHEVIRHYPPDTAAAFIWLKNRQPQAWRDKVEQKIEAEFKDVPRPVYVISSPEDIPETPEFLKDIERDIDSEVH